MSRPHTSPSDPQSRSVCRTDTHDVTQPGVLRTWASGQTVCIECEREQRRTKRYLEANRRAVAKYNRKNPKRAARAIRRITALRRKDAFSEIPSHQLSALKSRIGDDTAVLAAIEEQAREEAERREKREREKAMVAARRIPPEKLYGSRPPADTPPAGSGPWRQDPGGPDPEKAWTNLHASLHAIAGARGVGGRGWGY